MMERLVEKALNKAYPNANESLVKRFASDYAKPIFDKLYNEYGMNYTQANIAEVTEQFAFQSDMFE